MVEMLAVAAILVILLGISIVSVVRYRDLLKITELDNAAREIYMAAENRAVLLSGARRLSSQVDKSSGRLTKLTGGSHTGEEKLYYVSKASVTEDLLKTGSIDPALRNGDFYIVYDKNSGSVTDVFYAEDSLSGLVGSDFAAFYDTWAKSRSERLAKKNVMLVGWYNGQAAEGRDEEKDFPEEPWIRVIIENGEELTVTVEYEAPAPATLSVKLGNIDLTSGTYDVRKRDETVGTNGVSYTCTWVLDSLKNGQFKALNSGVTPGDDFTVEATIAPADGSSFTTASDSDDDNSLFQKGSSFVAAPEEGKLKGTCYIQYLRHLQNLSTNGSRDDSYNSGMPQYVFEPSVMEREINAVQTADILGYTNETYPEYNFRPISNMAVRQYDGRGHEIRDLYVNYTDSAGLFEKADEMLLRNIRMVNATVIAKGRTAGALAGEAHGAAIQSCWVYWETNETVADLKAVLGSDTDGYKFGEVGIFGSSAGGLVGEIGSGTKISSCLSATLIKGAAYAGGLVGKASGGEVVYSYADCYLTGDAQVAGLIGEAVSKTQVKLTDCYAAGFIMDGKSAAGLCLGGGTTNATNVYSVMRCLGEDIASKFIFLTGNQASDTFINTHFLHNKTEKITLSGGKEISGVSFDDMSAIKFIGTMGEAFEGKDPTDSHPYELRPVPPVYEYPGLSGMPHYGDWARELARLSLAYYEEDGGTTRVSGIGVRDLNDGTASVTADGYALLLLKKDDIKDGDTVNVTYTYRDKMGEQKSMPAAHTLGSAQTVTVNVDGEPKDFYVLPLPDTLVNSDYAEENFFRYIRFELTKGNGEGAAYKGEAFFNPHFAETVQNARQKAGEEGDWTAENVAEYAKALAGVMGEVRIRTPRHLYDLSQFKEYYTRSGVYHQMLDLDYSAYNKIKDLSEGQDPEDPEKIEYETEDKVNEAGEESYYAKQKPIGKWGEAFAGTYNGDYHVIKNVVPKVNNASQRRYAGLFGYSAGTLRSIVYEMDPEHQVTAYLGNATLNLYVGALAGGSSNIIENCAVSGANLRAGTSGVMLYVGGLVGQNSGTVRNCAAESARLSANCFNSARIYMGGLVGENAGSGSISTSYAVGRIDAEIDATVEIARICGFVGWNYGSISNCYAAVDLSSSGRGEKVELYGFCGEKNGSQSGNAYLDQGNFTYRDTSYAAKYARAGDKAESVTYLRLSGKDTEKPFSVAGMGTAAATHQGAGKEMEEKAYPFPTAVTDRDGKLVHYGHWPVPMPLGEMGVFYWEKMVDAEDGGNPEYYMSALAVDPQKSTITKRSTLSEAHNDGRVVVNYGYGYYEVDGKNTQNVTLTAENIGYTEFVGNHGDGRITHQALHLALENNKVHGETLSDNIDSKLTQAEKSQFKINQRIADDRSAEQERAAQTSFAEQMPGYIFHCWNSYHEGGKATNSSYVVRAKEAASGLYLFDGGSPASVDPNGGSFTLEQTGGERDISVTFCVNPQFAASMSVRANPDDLECADELKVNPGTVSNPYQVRCGAQLQEINWYDTLFTDVPVGFSGYTVNRFPYLNGTYYWEQTHDLDWIAEGNTYLDEEGTRQTGVFMTIAQTHANSGDPAPGWFGGSYDGRNYTMKNFNIGINTKNYEVNCMGLFGVVKNAELKNIVMFSESGEDVVTVLGRGSKADASERWYAGGVLAGLAQDSTISNCAVAGYTIRDETTYARSEREWNSENWRNYYTMGGAIGGLVGMTNQPLEGCTAAATIEIVCDHQNNTNGASAPIRVGGLVGSTTAKVENCYTGGEIVTSIQDENGNVVKQASNAAVYAGRLIGGVGMGPFGGEGKDEEVAVSNCYSYLTLPDSGGVVQARYNIGGGGRTQNAPAGTVDLGNNNYYLSGSADNVSGQRAVTYSQLAGKEEIGGQSIYELLNEDQDPAPYSPVTSEVGGLDVAGRFSYAPKDRQDLLGLDYPFPTILTQTRVSDGRKFNVHYGAWEPEGIVRPNGNKTIELDMFAWREKEPPEDPPKVEYAKEHTETLELRGVEDGGTWSMEVSDEVKAIVEASAENGELIVTALKANDTPVTVKVKYTTAGGEEYSRDITVKVTANVKLRPSAVKMFPNDVVTVQLAPYGCWPGSNNYMPLTEGTEGKLTVAADGVKSLDDTLDAKLAGSAAAPAITLTSKEGLAKSATVNVTYTYTQDDIQDSDPVKKTDQISVTSLKTPEGNWSEDGAAWRMDFGADASAISQPALADSTLTGFTPGVEGTAITLTKAADAQFPEEGVKLKVTLTLDGLEHKLTVTVPKPAAVAPEAQSAAAEGAAVILSQEGGTPLGDAEEKMEEQPGGVDPDGAAVSAGVHDGGGVDSDGGGLQRGQAEEQPGGASEVPDPVLGADPDL